jgi:predicted phosphate transport protein (TIGR00153 family)
MAFFNTTKKLILEIDEFFDAIDNGSLVFKEGVRNYLKGDADMFAENLNAIDRFEAKADSLRRKVENDLYAHSLLPQYRGDVLRLMEKCDDMMDIMKENLYQFDVEIPVIPKKLHEDILKLTKISVSAVDTLIPAARAFFKDPLTVKDKIHRVYFFEKEADKLANNIKRKVFHEFPNLKLSEKIHLRYFTLHIENVSDAAEFVADILSILAIKRIV